MSRLLSTLSVFILAIVLMATGCSAPANTNAVAEDGGGKIRIAASFYPLYDFARKIGGDLVTVDNLVPAGVEPHDWTPKGSDIKKISDADLFLYQGAGFEGWVDDFLKSLDKKSKVKPVMASEGVKLLPGTGEEHEEEHKDGEAHTEGDGHDHGEFDPHLWLSPMNAKHMAENIKNALIQVDAAHAAEYEANYEKLAKRFDDLHQAYKDGLAGAAGKEIVVSHQAFGYLANDYGLKQVPIMGLSPDAEPTAQQLKKIASFIREHNVKYIFFEELVSDKLAKTLAKDAGVGTLPLNPLEGLTDEDLKNGEDYFTIMEKNLKNLLQALQ